MEAAREGDRVRLELVLYDESGQAVDRTDASSPAETVLGSGSCFPLVETAVVGMAVGQTEEIDLSPEQAYGPRIEALVLRISAEQIPAEAKAGALLQVTLQGKVGLVRFLRLDDDGAVVDANHPLAGQRLRIVVTLIEIVFNSDADEEAKNR